AILSGEGEDASAAKAAPAAPKEAPKAAPAPAVATPAPVAAAPAPKPVPAAAGDRVKASPLARRLAEQQGIDLAAVQGTGPGGRVVKADLAGVQPGAAAPAARVEAPAAAVGAAPAPLAA